MHIDYTVRTNKYTHPLGCSPSQKQWQVKVYILSLPKDVIIMA